jgi:hypothetical protein
MNDIFPAASVKDFLKAINKLSNKKAMGIDKTSTVVLKMCVLVIAPCLAFIADRCGFRQGRSTVDAILTFQHYVLKGLEACEKAK